MTRAVITGVGVVSPFGFGTRTFTDALAEGRSAVAPIRSFDASRFPTRVAGEVPVARVDVDWLVARLPSANVERWNAEGWLRDRKLAWAVLAAQEAWASAGQDSLSTDATLSIALGLEQALLEDFAPIMRDGQIDWAAVSSTESRFLRLRVPVDVSANAIHELLNLRGPTAVHVSACAAGGLAVAHAASLIQRGAASIVLCGGADSMVNPLGVGGMSRLGAPSPRNEPDACRPFDRRRDGLVIGEGAAMFVVESEEHATARGARMLAEIIGWGSTQDAYRATAPRPEGSAAARAMKRALDRAGILPSKVGYINAHGTGTPLNDPAEARAIRRVFGPLTDRVPVSSIKGAVGHLMAAAGAIEIAACLLPFERDLLPGTAHHRELDPECDLDVIGEQPREGRVDVVLSNSFGFGGQNVCVALGRVT